MRPGIGPEGSGHFHACGTRLRAKSEIGIRRSEGGADPPIKLEHCRSLAPNRKVGDYLLVRPRRAVLRDDLLAVPRFRLETFALFFVTRFRLLFAEPLFFAARLEEEDLLPLDLLFAAVLRLLPKSLVFFAARTAEPAALAAAWAPLATCRAVR